MYTHSEQPNIPDRVVSALSYLSFGFIGFIWIIISVLTKTRLSVFMQFNIFQSIFLAIAFYLISMLLGFILNILSVIPLLNIIAAQIAFILNSPFIFGYSLIQFVIYLILFYLAFMAIIGRYGYLPFVSEIISHNVRR